MPSERYIICGDATGYVPAEHDTEALRLHLYGPEDDQKITLRIDDIRTQMYKDVPRRFHDLLDIATYVYATDQSVLRGIKDVETFGSSWRRHFHFVIPVRDLDFWRSDVVQQYLRETLGFLTDDHYVFEFVQSQQQTPFQTLLNFNDDGQMLGFPEQVIMFSGGLDSLGGAIEEIVNQKRRVVLVNHRPTQKLDKRYSTISECSTRKLPTILPCMSASWSTRRNG